MSEFMKKVSYHSEADEKAATSIEYGLIAAAIAIVIVSTIRLLGSRLAGTFTTLSNAV